MSILQSYHKVRVENYFHSGCVNAYFTQYKYIHIHYKYTDILYMSIIFSIYIHYTIHMLYIHLYIIYTDKKWQKILRTVDSLRSGLRQFSKKEYSRLFNFSARTQPVENLFSYNFGPYFSIKMYLYI